MTDAARTWPTPATPDASPGIPAPTVPESPTQAREAQGVQAAIRRYDPEAEQKLLRRRRGREGRFRLLGLGALTFACLFLAVLLVSIASRAVGAFNQATVTLTFPLSADTLGLRGNWGAEQLRNAPVRQIYYDALYALFPEATARGADNARANREALRALLPDLGVEILREQIRLNPDLVGQSVSLTLPLADRFDLLARGRTPRLEGAALERAVETEVLRRQQEGALDAGPVPAETRAEIAEALRTAHYAAQNLDPVQIGFFDQLVQRDLIDTRLNWSFITSPNAQSPEFAGLGGAIMGSIYTLLVCLVLALPIGVAAAVYLEEFAPKNRFTDLIEININNLAAVPSIIFGLLGLAVFVQFFGVPHGVPLVGGLVLALMTLPTIIIAGRAAIKAVPPSIREAALGLGASRQQAILHHVLPLAAPGILTGTIIGMAHALGETAPLIMIGMVQFVTSIPKGFTDSAAVLPVQIYLWSDQPQRGFEAKTSGAIVVLLLFLVLMNGAAIWLRRRFQRRW